jgi:hypothetical protein
MGAVDGLVLAAMGAAKCVPAADREVMLLELASRGVRGSA